MVASHKYFYAPISIIATILMHVLAGCGGGGGGDGVQSLDPDEWTLTDRSYLAVVAADINGDDALDIVFSVDELWEKIKCNYPDCEIKSSYDRNATVYMQDAMNPGSFVINAKYDLASAGYSLQYGDLNQNGLPDLAIAQRSDKTVRVLRNDEGNPGYFSSHADYPVSIEPETISIGDLNDDNINDIAAGGERLVLLINNPVTPGDNFFLRTLDIFEITSLSIEDIDDDGRNDLVITREDTITVLLQEPEPAIPGNFLDSTSYTAGATTTDNTVIDLNNDTLPDIAVSIDSEEGGYVSVHVQDPLEIGTYLPAVYYPVIQDSQSIASGDLSADSITDLVVANDDPGTGSVSVLLQDPLSIGNFLAADDYPGIKGPRDVAIGDMNGDGYEDLVVADNSKFPKASPYILFQDANSPGVFLDPSPLP